MKINRNFFVFGFFIALQCLTASAALAGDAKDFFPEFPDIDPMVQEAYKKDPTFIPEDPSPASAWAVSGAINAMFMTDSYGSRNPVAQGPTGAYLYEETAQPWLYVSLTLPGTWQGWFTQAWVQTQWYKNGEYTFYDNITLGNGVAEYWISPGNWASIHNPGYEVWDVYTYVRFYQGCDGLGSASGYTTFHTPEPISSALFLFGAGALTVRRFRKKKSA